MSPSGSLERERRRIVAEFFGLIQQGRFKDGVRLFAPDCVTHNPYVAGNMEVLTDAMVAANRQMAGEHSGAAFAVRHVLVDGDMVAVHTELLSSRSRPGDGGLRQVHLFRFDGESIVEYWDVTQQIVPSMPNAAGAFD